jgi:alkylation response protein AidB-like acyl-CoA dehydrogenase
MDFTFSEELVEIRRIARDFAEKEIRPHVMEWDEKQIFPRETLGKLADLGFLGILIPTEYGGAGLGYLEYVLIIEELSRVDGSIGISVAAHNSLCTGHIFNFGSEEQRRRFVVPLAKGEKIGAWSLTEPEAGSDAGGTQTTAKLDGDHWILNGQKTFTTHGSYGDICVAMAVTDKSAGHHGISAFILEKGMPGFSAGKKENKLGLRASDTSTVIFEDCRVPKENLLGEPGHGFIDALKILDGGRISIAALGVGMAQGACRRRPNPQWQNSMQARWLFASRMNVSRFMAATDLLRNILRRSSTETSNSAPSVRARVKSNASSLPGKY